MNESHLVCHPSEFPASCICAILECYVMTAAILIEMAASFGWLNDLNNLRGQQAMPKT
jgi:hypothetical protein